MKKEKPILMSTEMVQAILAERKTVTRRVINPQPPDMGERWTISNPYGMSDTWIFSGEKEEVKIKSKYQKGDIIWVRESWNWIDDIIGSGWYIFKADPDPDDPKGEIIKYKPSIHMPKEAARIWGEVLHVKPERVQDISTEDCIAEGITPEVTGDDLYENYAEVGYRWVEAKDSFRSLWQKINGTPTPIYKKVAKRNRIVGYEVYPFDDAAAEEFKGLKVWRGKPLTVCVNPWVWAISFETLSTDGKPETIN